MRRRLRTDRLAVPTVLQILNIAIGVPIKHGKQVRFRTFVYAEHRLGKNIFYTAILRKLHIFLHRCGVYARHEIRGAVFVVVPAELRTALKPVKSYSVPLSFLNGIHPGRTILCDIWNHAFVEFQSRLFWGIVQIPISYHAELYISSGEGCQNLLYDRIAPFAKKVGHVHKTFAVQAVKRLLLGQLFFAIASRIVDAQ